MSPCSTAPWSSRMFPGQSCNRNVTMAFGPEVIVTFLLHDWPGNIRELQGAVEHGLIHAHAEKTSDIEPAHLPTTVPASDKKLGACAPEIRQAAMEWMLRKTGGNQSE